MTVKEPLNKSPNNYPSHEDAKAFLKLFKEIFFATSAFSASLR